MGKFAKSFAAAAASAVLGLGAGSAAHAAVVTMTYSGIVSGGVDSVGVFGGGDLTGDAFTAVVTYDNSVGVQPDGVNSGSSYFNPLVSDSIAINGKSYSVPGSYIYTSFYELVHDGGIEEIGMSALIGYAVAGQYQTLVLGIPRPQLIEVTATPNETTFTSLDPSLLGPGLGFTYVIDGGPDDYIDLQVDSSSIDEALQIYATSIPEPATWSSLLAGMFACGAVMRLRRRKSCGLAIATSAPTFALMLS